MTGLSRSTIADRLAFLVRAELSRNGYSPDPREDVRLVSLSSVRIARSF